MSSYSPRHIFICTKSVSQILLWVILATFLFFSVLYTWPHILKTFNISSSTNLWTHISAEISINILFCIFPFGGFLGDAYFGRYKTVLTALTIFALAQLPATIGTILWYLHLAKITSLVLLIVSFIFVVLALSLFNSNILQFGLDQLMEKPSESMGVFAHWVVWSITVGASISFALFEFGFCGESSVNKAFCSLLYGLPGSLLMFFTIALLLSYFTRLHFSKDRVKYNPYKMIFKVLNFARKNKYPVGPVSAFAHCYDYRPSRLDYAKERYGGPFTTSDVEDVKAFKKVFVVLLSLGPVFALDFTSTNLPLRAFERHTESASVFNASNITCPDLRNIGLYRIFGVIVMPIYMWLIYCVFRNRRPKILHRLIVAAFFYILAALSMPVLDITGHIALLSQNQTQPMCMFVQKQHPHHTLELQWELVKIPNFVKSCSFVIMMATSLEFISAQSPQVMKGVLVGSLFAILGTFENVGAVLFIPFSLDKIWKDDFLTKHPPVVSCAFGYYLACITVAMIGFVSFIIAVKRYKYRRRDEEPYSQACVEEIFARRIANSNEHKRREGYKELQGVNTPDSP